MMTITEPDHANRRIGSPPLTSLDFSQALQKESSPSAAKQVPLARENPAKTTRSTATQQKVRKLKISCGTNNPEKVSKAIDNCLKETPMMFMDKSHPAEIRIGLPESADVSSIRNIIAQSIPADTNISEMCPTAKVTILNVPENIESLSREEAKTKVLKSLLDKNSWLKEYDVSVVYIKSHFKNKDKCTVALRLPVPGQKLLLETGKVYYASCRLNVVERFHIPQCIRCHQFNHQTKDCTSEVLACKLCGENHDVKDCSNTEKRFCVNCFKSEKFRQMSSEHHSGDRNCPFRTELIQQQAKNLLS